LHEDLYEFVQTYGNVLLVDVQKSDNDIDENIAGSVDAGYISNPGTSIYNTKYPMVTDRNQKLTERWIGSLKDTGHEYSWCIDTLPSSYSLS
jgi:hypothetical protein